MNYSPLAVHCTSLCFDVIQSQYFDKLTIKEIEDFKSEIYWLLKERACMWPLRYPREHEFLDAVAQSIVNVLTQCRRSRSIRSTEWVLNSLEFKIEGTITSLLY